MDLVLADFEHLVGKSFDVPAEEAGEVFTQLILCEVSRLPHGHPARLEPFSLIFEGSRGCALEQGTYWLIQPALGERAIFLVPLGDQGEMRRYQAIFN